MSPTTNWPTNWQPGVCKKRSPYLRPAHIKEIWAAQEALDAAGQGPDAPPASDCRRSVRTAEDDKAAAHNGLPRKRGRPGYRQAGIHELQLAPIDDGALGVMTIAARSAILLSEDGVDRHRLAIEASLMRAAG